MESIVGPVEDEFDSEGPNVKEEEPGKFVVLGNTPIRKVEKALQLNLDDEDVDTVAGVLMSCSGKLPAAGDRVEFEGAVAEIIDVNCDHVASIRFILYPAGHDEEIPDGPDATSPQTS